MAYGLITVDSILDEHDTFGLRGGYKPSQCSGSFV